MDLASRSEAASYCLFCLHFGAGFLSDPQLLRTTTDALQHPPVERIPRFKHGYEVYMRVVLVAHQPDNIG